MIRRNLYIFVLAALFLGVATLLHQTNFWHKVGLEEPHGYEGMGLLFLTLVLVLQNTLFLPYVKVLEERENQTVKKKEAAQKTQIEAEEMIGKYRRAIEEARIRATSEREKIALEAENQERSKLMAAKEASNADLTESLKLLSGEAEKTRTALKKEVDSLAKEIAEGVTKPKGSHRKYNSETTAGTP